MLKRAEAQAKFARAKEEKPPVEMRTDVLSYMVKLRSKSKTLDRQEPKPASDLAPANKWEPPQGYIPGTSKPAPAVEEQAIQASTSGASTLDDLQETASDVTPSVDEEESIVKRIKPAAKSAETPATAAEPEDPVARARLKYEEDWKRRVEQSKQSRSDAQSRESRDAAAWVNIFVKPLFRGLGIDDKDKS